MFDIKDCLVSFKTTQSIKLRILFESLHAILGDGLLDFTPDGVFLTASTATGIIVVNMPKENIEEYVCVQNVECGIKFAAMYAYLKNVNDTDVVGIQVTRDGYNGAYLFVCNSGAEGKCDAYRSMYQIRLVMLNRFEITQMMPEELHMDTCVTLPSTTFQRFLRSHEKVDTSPDLNIQIMAHIPEPGPDGTLPTQGDVYFVSNGQDAHLVTSSSFPIFRSTDDPTNVFESAFVEEEKEDEPPPAEASEPSVAEPELQTLSLPQPSKVEDRVKFVIDSRFLKIETSLFYAHRSSDKKEQYSLKTLLEIAKMTGMSHSVRLFLAPEAPLAIVYDIGTLGSVLLFVAPKSDEVVNCSLATVVPQNIQGRLQVPAIPSMRVVSKQDCDRPASIVVDMEHNQKRSKSRRPGGGRPRKYPPDSSKPPPKKRTKKGDTGAASASSASGSGTAEDDPMDETVLENADGDDLDDREVYRSQEHGL